jgi:hypothetical protein
MTFYSKSFVVSFVVSFVIALLPSCQQLASSMVEGFVFLPFNSKLEGTRLGVSNPSFSTASPFDEDQYIYIPQSDLEEAIQKEKKRHEMESEKFQSVIDNQRQELQRLKEKDRKERLKHKMYFDSCWTENQQLLWSENHTEKMTRFQSRLVYLTDENVHLQDKLEEESSRHSKEIQQLESQLQQEKEKSQEAKDVLGLERAYYETSVRLLEAGLEREGCKVKSLQTKLKAQKLRTERSQGHSIEQPLPQRNLHQQQPLEQQPIQNQYQQQIFEELQQHKHEESSQYNVFRPHENQYFEQFQQGQQQQQHQQQEQQAEQQYQHRQQQQQQQQQQQHSQRQEYHSDQFGFENAHYYNLHDHLQRQQQERSQQQRTGRHPSVIAEQRYYNGGPYSTVGEQLYGRVSQSPRRAHGRTVIPTMNGQHMGGGGLNDLRNRLY